MPSPQQRNPPPQCLSTCLPQEQENLSLAADNARLQQQIAELEALNKAATADAQQRAQHASSNELVDGMEARATMALQRVEHNRRLSGVYEVSDVWSRSSIMTWHHRLVWPSFAGLRRRRCSSQ